MQTRSKVLLALTLVATALGGCIYRPKSFAELRDKGPNRQETYSANYQALASCWEANAEPTYVDFKRSSFVTVYPDLGKAEVSTGFSLFEFKRVDDSTTLVTSYDGEMHAEAHRKWFETVSQCASGSLK